MLACRCNGITLRLCFEFGSLGGIAVAANRTTVVLQCYPNSNIIATDIISSPESWLGGHDVRCVVRSSHQPCTARSHCASAPTCPAGFVPCRAVGSRYTNAAECVRSLWTASLLRSASRLSAQPCRLQHRFDPLCSLVDQPSAAFPIPPPSDAAHERRCWSLVGADLAADLDAHTARRSFGVSLGGVDGSIYSGAVHAATASLPIDSPVSVGTCRVRFALIGLS